MCLKLSFPVDCTTHLTPTSLVSIKLTCVKIHQEDRNIVTWSDILFSQTVRLSCITESYGYGVFVFFNYLSLLKEFKIVAVLKFQIVLQIGDLFKGLLLLFALIAHQLFNSVIAETRICSTYIACFSSIFTFLSHFLVIMPSFFPRAIIHTAFSLIWSAPVTQSKM